MRLPGRRTLFAQRAIAPQRNLLLQQQQQRLRLPLLFLLPTRLFAPAPPLLATN